MIFMVVANAVYLQLFQVLLSYRHMDLLVLAALVVMGGTAAALWINHGIAVLALKIVVFAFILVVPIHHFFIQPYRVEDNSMSPDFQQGDLLLVNRLPYFNRSFNRGEVIVFRDTSDYKVKFLRRIAGLPGERIVIKDGIMSVENQSYEVTQELPLFGSVMAGLDDVGNLDQHEYFVVSNSGIKAPIGMVDERFMIGSVMVRIWPFKSINVYIN